MRPDGTLWVTSDEGSDFQRLGTLDPATGRFTPVVTDTELGRRRLRHRRGRQLHRLSSSTRRGSAASDCSIRAPAPSAAVAELPAGVIGGARDRALGRDRPQPVLGAQRRPTPIRSIPDTLAVTRWTESETGGLDPNVNVEPELVEVEQLRRRGSLGLPLPARRGALPGPPAADRQHPRRARKGQSRPGFLGRNNYLLNELGIAIFYPNVRGSTGFGKRFVSLDNGPALRENSVKDIGAFLDRARQAIRRSTGPRFAVTGGSYGGYMCYASAIRYGDAPARRQLRRRHLQLRRPSSRTRKAIAATCAASNMATSAIPRSAPSCSRSQPDDAASASCASR